MSQSVSITWGQDSLTSNLPDTWNLLGSMEPSPCCAVADPTAEAERALQSPFGMGRLYEQVHPNTRIALVIDDASRPTPVRQILPAVLAELVRGGARFEQITLVPALGLHRSMTEEEIAHRVGGTYVLGMAIEHHDPDSAEKLCFLGATSRGTPVFINKVVAEADLVISIGCIEPHLIASFGGGYKNLLPGVAGRATIAHNHSLNCHPHTFNSVGQPIERNPMRLDLEEGGAMLKAPVFIVNAVLNSRTEVVKVVAGHPVAAHRVGVKVSAEIFGVKIPRQADVVITASHPMDHDLRQGVKALGNTVMAVKPGGVMITLVRAEEGVGVFGLANKKLPLGRGGFKLLAPVILPLVPKLKLKGMGEEDKFFLYFALQAMRRASQYMYAPTIPAATKANLPFVEFVDSFEAALAKARQRFPRQADVLVFPYGGSTYPILPG